MDDETNEVINKVKSVLKKVGKKVVIAFLPIIIIIVLLSSFVYFITIDDGTYKEGDWSSTAYAAGQYTSNITVNADGSISSSMNAQELWDKMLENDSRVDKYLDSPEELVKLMNAETITQFPDMRENPTGEIDWSSINNIEESTLQGIIKFKRSDSAGNESNLIYAEPYKFDGWLEEFNSADNDTDKVNAKKNLLSHFTLRQNTTSTDGTSGETNVVVTGKVADVTAAIVNEITKKNNYGLGKSQCQAWVGKAYAAAGLGYYPSGCCAYLAGKKWGVSSDFTKIISGSAVWTGDGHYKYTQCSTHTNGGCGHAGIYYEDNGTGYVMHLINGTVRKDKLSDWLNTYGEGNTPVWGWQGGIKVVEEGESSNSTTDSSTTNSETETTIKNTTTSNGYYVEVVSWNEFEETVESDDPEVNIEPKHTYNLTTKQINYQDMVSDYTMPFEYLWSMLVVTEDKDFVMELADLVYNSKIEITIYDNLTTNTNTEVYTYTRKKNVFTKANVYVKYFKVSTEEPLSQKRKSDSGWIHDIVDEDDVGNFTTTVTTITKTNTLSAAVTLADVWMAKYQQTYSNKETTTDSPTTTSELDDVGYPDEYDKFVEGNKKNKYAKALIDKLKEKIYEENTLPIIYSSGINSVTEEIYYSTVNINKAVSNSIKSNTYISSQNLVEPKTDKDSEEANFVTIFLDPNNLKAKNNILNVTSWLFELLETNNSTKDLLDLTKYLLYKATGTDYGIKEFDFSIFSTNNFKSLTYQSGGVSNLDGVPGQIYDFLLGKGVPAIGAAAILGNIENESSFNPTVVNELGCSGLCQWYKGRLNNLKNLANSRGVEWTDVNVQLEYLWSELENSYTSVKNVIMNATTESDLEYATWYWGRYFEVYMLGSYESTRNNAEPKERYEAAKKWYNAWVENHTGSYESTQVGEAAKISGTDARIKWLYDGNGIPTTEEENNKYLETFPVQYLDSNGNLQTMNVKMHRKLKTEIQAIFQDMVNIGFKVVGGNISYRTWGSDAGFKGRFPQSAHTYGHAFDVNPTQNYCIYANGSIVGDHYSPGSDPYSVTDNVINIWKQHGFYWGGDWSSPKDYMHFSYFNH